MKKILLIIFLLFFNSLLFAQNDTFNFDLENINKLEKFPFKWKKRGTSEFEINIDNNKYSGSKSILIFSDSIKNNESYGGIKSYFDNYYQGKEIVLEGYVKVDELSKGFAGIFLYLEDGNNILKFIQTESTIINKKSDWKKYSLKLNLNEKTKRIYFGGFLQGIGKIWLDNFNIFIDGRSIKQIENERTLGYSLYKTLFKNVNYFDIKSKKFKHSSILISNGKIVDISSKIKETKSMQIIDAKDKYLISGLVDSHIHLFQSGGLYTRPDVIDLTHINSYKKEKKWLKDNTEDLLKRYLSLGITTVIDVGGPISNFQIRDKYKNSINHPNIYLTGPLISTYQPDAFKIKDSPIIKANTKQEAIKLVQEQLPYKPDFIKIWYIVNENSTNLDYDIVKTTIEEAHKHNLKVAVHAQELKTAKLSLKAGADILVHSVNEKIDNEFITLLKKRKVIYIPTFVVHDNYIKVFGRNFEPSNVDFKYANPFVLGTIYDTKNKELVDYFNTYTEWAKRTSIKDLKTTKIMIDNLNKLLINNIDISLGTDAGNIGTFHATSYYEEIKMMKKTNLTYAEILISATYNGAKMLGKEDEFGSIEVNKKADLLLLNSDPLVDINNLKDINVVMKGGNLLYPNKILIHTASELVQQQLNGYNARNIEAFLAPYDKNVEVYEFPEKLKYNGINKMKPIYDKIFKNTPNLHCELVNRIVKDNTIIDHEKITGFYEGYSYEAIVIYEIKNEKIVKVIFVK